MQFETLRDIIIDHGVTPAAGGPGAENGGWDIQQSPVELAIFINFCQAHGVKTVLELGTGPHAGFARFMATALNWDVTSVDVNMPDATANGIHFIQATTQDAYPLLGGKRFDLVFIDACHHYAFIQADHHLYGPLGRIVAFHDIAPGWVEVDCGRYWNDVAYLNGRLKPLHFEAVGRNPSIGIGWYLNE